MLHRCPAWALRDVSIQSLLPYFFHWRATEFTQFPDGCGRIMQPSMLLEAFSIMNTVAQEREKAEMEAKFNHGK
jgi:hypothetical protein